MYFLPILHRAWFREPTGEWARQAAPLGLETHWMLLIPPVLTALLALLAGLLADAPFSPLSWATRIAEGEYLR
jgi:multicomponent Na+:H+ antiporter subunit D